MNARIAILIFFVFLFAVPLLARDKTDVLVMRNGDRLTCEVKGLASGVLYVTFDYIDGTTSVDWSKVAKLESKQLFVVKTEDGSVYTGTLGTMETPAGRPVVIKVVDPDAPESGIDRSQITEMIATSDKLWQRFNGALNFGVIYSKGNQSTQYALGSQMVYVRERWKGQVNFASNLSSSSGAAASTRNSLNTSALRLLPWNKWFYEGAGHFLQSSEQGISLQSSLGGGLGKYLKDTDRTSISVLGGAAWQNTQYQPSVVSANTQNVAAALFYLDAKFFRFSKTNFNLTATFLPALSDPGRIRFNTNATYYLNIFHNLNWNLSFYGNWDNRPPATFSGSDYGTSSGVSWTFGLK